MIIGVEALAGGGFVAVRDGQLQLFDHAGRFVRDIGPGTMPVAAPDGAFANARVDGSQWYDADGAAIGGPFAFATPADSLPGSDAFAHAAIATAAGNLVLNWDQIERDLRGGVANEFEYFAAADRDGTVINGPDPGPQQGRTPLPTQLARLHDDRIAAVYQNQFIVGPRYHVQFLDGAAVPLGGPIGLAQTDPYGGPRLIDTEVLADGSLALLFETSSNSADSGRIPLVVLRTDAQGNAIGAAAELYNPPFPRDIGEFFANQDGGYTRLWQIWGVGLKYEVYDSAGNTLTGQLVAVPFVAGAENYTYAADMLADGRIAIVIENTNDPSAPFVTTHFVDYTPSHTATYGGEAATIATWQEQEAITRAAGVDMLFSSAGVAMKPWIANFVVAGDADGINATANELANHLVGGGGANVFIAGGGNDKLYGLAGDDWLLGQGGNDLIDGGAGDDVGIGGLGNDSIAAGNGADTVAGDAGDDALDGQGGDDIVHGGDGRDLVSGSAGNDTLTGGAGNDWLSGGDGDDSIAGDRGADTLEGGDGADLFVLRGESGRDVLRDLQVGQDRIAIELDAEGRINGIAVGTSADLISRVTDVAGGALLDLGEGNTILLAHRHVADLASDLFLLT